MADFSLVPSGHGTNYTGMLTRSIVFSVALLVFLAGASYEPSTATVVSDNVLPASGMTIASIAVPDWIAYDGSKVRSFSSLREPTADKNQDIHYTYGLHRKCSNTNIFPPAHPYNTGSSSIHCVQFPRYEDCRGDDRYFCSMWRSVGFLMSFAVVLEGMTIVAFAVLLIGGKQKREQGWGVLTILVALAAFVQALGMALMVEACQSSRIWTVH